MLKQGVEDKSDLTTTYSGTGKASETQEIRDLSNQITAIEKELQNVEANPPFPDLAQNMAVRDSLNQRLEEVKGKLTDAKFDAGLDINTDSNGNSIYALASNLSTPSSQEMSSRVDTFLTNLYEALDGPHQEFEQTLRGKLLPGATRDQIIGGAVPGAQDQYGAFRPPFSPLGRARGGDLKALALQGSTAIDNMGKAWQEFGENLQDQPKKADLQGDITRLERKIALLNAEETKLNAALASGSQIASPDGDIPSRLASLSSERTHARQELAKAQADLQVIRNKEGQAPP